MQTRLPKAIAHRVAAMLASACLAVLALCCAVPLVGAAAYAAAAAIDYDGDSVAFIAADGSQLDSYPKKSGTSVRYVNGSIAVTYVTTDDKNEAGFYLGADKDDDEEAWEENPFYVRKDGRLAFTLDSSYAGKAWPIVSYNRKDMADSLATQYYFAIPPLESIPGYLLTVTFTDGQGKELDVQKVVSGGDATPPSDPERAGYVFDGWDRSLTDITEDMTVNAKWTADASKSYTVTFVGWNGETLKTETVKGGAAATPPKPDPAHEGYVFTGWKSDCPLDCVTEDLVAVAQWLSNDDAALEAAQDAIAALPEKPVSVAGDTDNEAVAAAVAAYRGLSGELRSKLTDDELLRLAKCAIVVLPSDPYDVAGEHGQAISAARELYESLPDDLQDVLDATESTSESRSYGRYLENNVWALASLEPVDNTTSLADGVYTAQGQVDSSSNMGKATSRRGYGFTVTSVAVKGGRATATVEHGSNASESLKVGGVEYPNLQTDGAKHSYYEIPIDLNSTFYFSYKGKGATEATDAIACQMVVAADESTMKPDPEKEGTDPVVPDKESDDGGQTKKTGSTGTKSTKSSGTKLTATGSTASTGTTSSSNASKLAAARASNAGNLSSLLRTNNASSQASAAKNAPSQETKKSGSSASASTGGAADDMSMSEVELASAAPGSALLQNVDVAPAVAGGCLLFASLGALAFALRFVRRESAFV